MSSCYDCLFFGQSILDICVSDLEGQSIFDQTETINQIIIVSCKIRVLDILVTVVLLLNL